MHAERFEVSADLEATMQYCRESGGRVVAIGTTVCRALEAHARGDRGSTDLIILPGHRFQAVDGLLTNFHTPRSTLLALVAAVAQHLGAADGLAFVKRSYAAAIRSISRLPETVGDGNRGGASRWRRNGGLHRSLRDRTRGGHRPATRSDFRLARLGILLSSDVYE